MIYPRLPILGYPVSLDTGALVWNPVFLLTILGRSARFDTPNAFRVLFSSWHCFWVFQWLPRVGCKHAIALSTAMFFLQCIGSVQRRAFCSSVHGVGRHWLCVFLVRHRHCFGKATALCIAAWCWSTGSSMMRGGTASFVFASMMRGGTASFGRCATQSLKRTYWGGTHPYSPSRFDQTWSHPSSIGEAGEINS